MSKFKIGDIVKPLPYEDAYLHPCLIAGENYTVEGYTSDGKVNVSGEFRGHGDGIGWDEEWFELVEKDDSAEVIRSNILSIREKRNDLLMEIAALDKEEAKLVEKLKQQGFVLYESALQAPTEKKTVLYAEDIEEDMNDPKNWKVGDLVTVIENDFLDPFSVGEVVELLEACENPFCKGEGHRIWAMTWEQLKFHSRPL